MSPSPGRPRDQRVTDAALDATRELLVEVGYAGLTWELVAHRARTSKTALHRRWPNRAALVLDAAFGQVRPDDVVETGDVGRDLVALVRALEAELAGAAARASVAGLLADLGADAAAREQTRDQVLRPVADALHALLVRAVRRGDLADDTPVEALVAALGGAVFLRAVVLDVPARPQDAEDLVRLLLHGAARADPR